MEKSVLDGICQQVYARYPEVRGKRPTKQDYGSDQVLLVFKASAALPGGKKMDRAIRVVATDSGKIVKMSASK